MNKDNKNELIDTLYKLCDEDKNNTVFHMTDEAVIQIDISYYY